MALFLFRIILVTGFCLAAWKWGNWKKWQAYYPTVLFVMLVNMSAGYLTYQHGLWNYSDDAFVAMETIVEFINTYINLPATVFIYLSNFPPYGAVRKLVYAGLWVMLYGALEFADHYIFGGIFYTNGWSWGTSLVFNTVMFSVIRVHYLSPLKAWVLVLIVGNFIIWNFGFITGEMK